MGRGIFHEFELRYGGVGLMLSATTSAASWGACRPEFLFSELQVLVERQLFLR